MRVGGPDDQTLMQCLVVVLQEQRAQRAAMDKFVADMAVFKERISTDLKALKDTVDALNKNMSSAGKNCACGTSVQQGGARSKTNSRRRAPQGESSDDDNPSDFDPNVNRRSEKKSHKPSLEPLSNSDRRRPAHQNSISPVQLNNNPPRNIHKPQASKKQSPIKDFSRLFEVEREPLRNRQVISSQPQQTDFATLMKSFGMEINAATLAAVSSAAEGMAGKAGNRSPGLHTVVVLDTSESMKGQPLQVSKTFLTQMIDGVDSSAGDLGLEEYIAVITCGKSTKIAVPFTNDYVQVRNMLDRLTGDGRTPLMTALTLALCYLQLQGECVRGCDLLIKPRLIILSDFLATMDTQPFDGKDQEGSSERIKVQGQLFNLAIKFAEQDYGVVVVPVGAINEPVVEEFSSKCHGQLIRCTGDGADPNAVKDVGLYYRYKLCVAWAMMVYDTAMKRDGTDTDVFAHLLEALPKANLNAVAHKSSATRMLEKELELEDDINDVVDIEEDALESAQTVSEEPEGEVQPEDTRTSMSQVQQEAPPAQSRAAKSQAQTNGARPQVNQERPELPRWSHTRNVDSITFEEQSGLPSIGSRVVRGKDWKWEDQDGGGPGTIVGHKDKGIAYVLWDNHQIGAYRYNYEGTYDLQKVREPREVPPGEIEVGCSVVRGPDWDRGDEDGGRGTVGVVVRKLRDRYVTVRWPSRVVETYRFGAQDKWELEVSVQSHHSSGRGTPQDGNEAVGFQPQTSEVPAQKQAAANVPLRPWWLLQDKSNQWRLFSQESVEKLESKKEAKHQHCVVAYQNNTVRCFLEQNKCEVAGNTYPLKREMMTDEEIETQKSIEQFLPPLN